MSHHPSIFLRSDVFAVQIETDLAILDLADDRYLCLTQVFGSVEMFDPDAPTTWPLDLVRQMAEAGLLDERAVSVDRTRPRLPSTTPIHDIGLPGISAQDIVLALRATTDVLRIARQNGIRPLLGLGLRNAGPGPQRNEDVVKAAWRFSRILPWLPIEGACLIRSALLVRYLSLKGLHADWVFGVRMWPFSAHCWVQIDDVCLNDDPERLIGFSPIYRR